MHYLDKPGVQPIKHLLLDEDISEIMITGLRRLYIEKGGVMQRLSPVFTASAQLEALIENLVGPTGRAVNVRSPFVDFRLPDGSRVNVVVAPIALDGPVVTIRKATRSLRTMEDLIARRSLTQRMSYFLYTALNARLNILFSGGTGTGKTTTLGMLAAYIPESERIVVIEDTAELDFRQPHVVRMECRPPNMEGIGAITLADLLRNSLRMRPTRIVVGEVRGDEAFDMLNAMSSGHDGSLGVLHASSPSHAVARLELMVLSRGLPLPLWAIQRQIAGAVHIIVQHAILLDGSRRITHISEVTGVANDQVEVKHLFEYELSRYDDQGKPIGYFKCTGEEPRCLDKLKRVGGDELAGLFKAGMA